MTLQEIKSAVQQGKTVHWSNPLYIVKKHSSEDYYYIECSSNKHCIGLTHTDEVTMNGKEEDFYIEDEYVSEKDFEIVERKIIAEPDRKNYAIKLKNSLKDRPHFLNPFTYSTIEKALEDLKEELSQKRKKSYYLFDNW